MVMICHRPFSNRGWIEFGLVILTFSMTLILFCASGQCMALEVDKEVVLRGRVICVDQDIMETSCESEDHSFALKVNDGRKFVFLPDDPNSKVFEDQRLHQRELQINAWDRGQNRLEIIKVYSVKEGRLFDIHYFCSICNIKAFVGGLCWCCQEEFEFRETPVP